MNEPASRTKAKVLAVLIAAAASCGVIVYAILRGTGDYREWKIAAMSFPLPKWIEREVNENQSFGVVELVKEDGTAGLMVRWERLNVGMTIPVQAHLVKIIGNNLRYMMGGNLVATPAGRDVPIQVGPHKGRRIEFTFNAPGARYLASVTLWTCSRTERVGDSPVVPQGTSQSAPPTICRSTRASSRAQST